MQELRQWYPLPGLLKVAGLARSTFYYQLQASRAGDKHETLRQEIRSLQARHRGRYGYRRITAALCQAGKPVNHKTVCRLMREMGLQSLVRRKKYRSYRGEVGRIAPNRLERKFEAAGPNQKWVTDVTEFKVAGEKLYLSPLLDLYNGEVIAYEISCRPVFGLVGKMLGKAVARLEEGEAPLLHSDQGWQYQMPAYQRLLEQHGIVQSMSRKGNCLDNAAMESFFAILKSEYFHLTEFSTVQQLRSGLAEYIHYYNHDRIKMKLKGLSPVQYRTQPLPA